MRRQVHLLERVHLAVRPEYRVWRRQAGLRPDVLPQPEHRVWRLQPVFPVSLLGLEHRAWRLRPEFPGLLPGPEHRVSRLRRECQAWRLLPERQDGWPA